MFAVSKKILMSKKKKSSVQGNEQKSDENKLPSIKKRKAIRKKIVEPKGKQKKTRGAKKVKPRKQSSYNLLQKEISEYCKKNYNRKCSKSEISDIYRSLKERFFDVNEKKLRATPQEIAKEIDSKLAYRQAKSMPTFLSDFPWFDVLSRLWSNDGGFFKEDDMLTFDLSDVGLGKRKTPFFALVEIYQDEIYADLIEFFEEVESQTGKKLNQSPIPRWVYQEELSDAGNRKFVWKILFDDDDGAVKATTGKNQGEITEDDRQQAIQEAQAQESTKSKTDKELELEIEKEKTAQEREKTKQQAMDLLQKGLITPDQFTKLIS
jgi:hypothetical protein